MEGFRSGIKCGKTCVVSMPNSSLMIDSLFSNYFGVSSSELRNQQLDILYRNKPLMIEASIAFIVIFSSFLNDPLFYVRGISAQGTFPQPEGYAKLSKVLKKVDQE